MPGAQAAQPMRAAAALQQWPPRQAPEGQVALSAQTAPGAVALQRKAPAAALKPGAQQRSAPGALVVLAAQGMQLGWPVLGWYVPGGQGVQAV